MIKVKPNTKDYYKCSFCHGKADYFLSFATSPNDSYSMKVCEQHLQEFKQAAKNIGEEAK